MTDQWSVAITALLAFCAFLYGHYIGGQEQQQIMTQRDYEDQENVL